MLDVIFRTTLSKAFSFCAVSLMESKMLNENLTGGLVLLTVGQVAQRLSVSTRTVWRLVSGGQLPQPVSIGRCKRWPGREIDQYIESLKCN